MAIQDYFSREARLKRRDDRLKNHTKVAGVITSFDSKYKDTKISAQNAGIYAVGLVREVLGNFNVHGLVKLGYSGIRHAHIEDKSKKLTDGVVTISAEYHTPSGVNVTFDVPVEIAGGHLLEPSLIMVGGVPKIIAQSTFDALNKSNSIYDQMPIRDLYSAPLQANDAKERYNKRVVVPKYQNGLFASKRAEIKRALAIRADIDMDALLKQYHDDGTVTEHPVLTGLPKAKGPYEIHPGFGYGNAPANSIPVKPSPGPEDPTSNMLDETDPSKTMLSRPWPTASRKADAPTKKDYFDTAVSEHSKSLDKTNHPKRNPEDRNQQDMDCLDPAERYEQHDLCPGMDVSLAVAMEVRDRGGVRYPKNKGSKCHIVRDHAGDNKSFVVRFEDGFESIVERFHLKADRQVEAAKKPPMPKPYKPPKQPAPPKSPKMKNKPDRKRLCTRCMSSPCKCDSRRKSMVVQAQEGISHTLSPTSHEKIVADHDLVSKVVDEIRSLQADDVADLDVRAAMSRKYPSHVVESAFSKVAPDKE